MNPLPEEIDLAVLAASMVQAFAGSPPAGYVEGKTALRDWVVSRLDCSELEAEQIVDTMVARGFLRFTGDPGASLDDGVWQLELST